MRVLDPRVSDPRVPDPRASDPRASDPRASDPRRPDARGSEPPPPGAARPGAGASPGATRRGALGGGLALAGAAAGFAWLSREGLSFGAPRFEPVPGLPGLRRLAGEGRITGLPAATIGLGGSGPVLPRAARAAARARIAADPLAAIHPAGAGDPPVTFFTAGGCPLCPRLSGRLADLGLAPAHRPLALFGPASTRAARAIVAAARLAGPSAAARLHDRLTGTAFRTEDPFILAIAAEEGLDPDALLPAMDAADTDAALAANHALSSALGLPGTPAVVIGRTLAIGLPSRGTLRAILAQESA